MFELREENSLWFQNRICVPDIPEIKGVILREAHQTPYSIHPGSTKMYGSKGCILVEQYEKRNS
jgi:hypothetical protein